MADPVRVPFLSWTIEPTDGSTPIFGKLPCDVIFKVQPSHSGVSTDSPVQQGVNVTDNCRRQPMRLVIEFAVIGGGTYNDTPGLTAYDVLVKLQKDATLVSFTQARTWSDMFIELIEVPDTLEPVMGRVRFIVHLKEILLTTLKVTPPKARPVTARKPVKRGHQDCVTAPVAEKHEGYADWSDLYSNYYSDQPTNPQAEKAWNMPSSSLQ